VEAFAPCFTGIFTSTDDFQHKAFAALEYAYIGARYDKHYYVAEPTVTYLAERVGELLKLTEACCQEKIAALEEAASNA
jgi:hypothetical protein